MVPAGTVPRYVPATPMGGWVVPGGWCLPVRYPGAYRRHPRVGGACWVVPWCLTLNRAAPSPLTLIAFPAVLRPSHAASLTWLRSRASRRLRGAPLRSQRDSRHQGRLLARCSRAARSSVPRLRGVSSPHREPPTLGTRLQLERAPTRHGDIREHEAACRYAVSRACRAEGAWQRWHCG